MLLNSGPRLRSTSPLAGPSVDHGAIGSVGLAHGLVTRIAPPATGKYHNCLKTEIFQHWSTGPLVRGPCQPPRRPPRKCTANFFRPHASAGFLRVRRRQGTNIGLQEKGPYVKYTPPTPLGSKLQKFALGACPIPPWPRTLASPPCRGVTCNTAPL